MYKVEPFSIKYLDALIEVGLQMHQEGAYSFLPYDKDKLRVLISSIMKSSTSIIYIALEEDKLIGFYALYLAPYFFCTEYLCQDYVLYILPAYRGKGKLAITFIKKGIQWAINKGATEFCPGISTGVNIKGVKSLYNRLGFETVGYVFKRRLK